jgi:hypothetical protein
VTPNDVADIGPVTGPWYLGGSLRPKRAGRRSFFRQAAASGAKRPRAMLDDVPRFVPPSPLDGMPGEVAALIDVGLEGGTFPGSPPRGEAVVSAA